jgi:hypothetical protein
MLLRALSETMRTAFMDYAKSINLITETVHGGRNRPDHERTCSHVPLCRYGSAWELANATSFCVASEMTNLGKKL